MSNVSNFISDILGILVEFLQSEPIFYFVVLFMMLIIIKIFKQLTIRR